MSNITITHDQLKELLDCIATLNSIQFTSNLLEEKRRISAVWNKWHGTLLEMEGSDSVHSVNTAEKHAANGGI